MKLGLIGLKGSGKTTIFNALTRSAVETAFSGGKAKPNIAVVEVEDPRVDALSEMYKPKKTIYATIDVMDFMGVSAGDAKSGLYSGEDLNLVKSSDALAAVVRNFPDAMIDEMQGAVDPARDLESLESELLLADLVVVENRLERIEADRKRGKKAPGAEAEEKVLGKIADALNDGTALRDLEFSGEERKTISGFQFLTLKPLMVVLNSDEDSYGKSGDFLAALSDRGVEFAGSFEMELAMLEPDEAAAFMDDMGITESARVRLTAQAYAILDYLSFFTVGEDEVRAWTITRGENAVDAAGAIHSDLARGFIRAECFSYDDIMSAGSEKGIKEQGLFRLEGKEYVVQDGDILNIRFSV